MNINLNLATRPYFELRPVYARLRVAAVVLAVLALPMLLVLHAAQTRAQLAEARVNQLQSNIVLLRRQQNSARALATEGPNAQVLTQAAFLNDLFRRKAFSWTATMSDLENTLPPGVQVQTIDPVVAPDGRVTIRLRVNGPRERAVDVVHNLERSRYFVTPRLVSEALANQNSGGNARSVSMPESGPAAVTFDIISGYRPLPNTHTGERVRAPAPRSASQAAAPAQLTNPEPAAATPAPYKFQTPYGQRLRKLPPPLGERPE